ncbi:MAG: hypothetical protein Q7J46_14350 [Pseudomonas sp.]|nr:hypothetical protein [Pseudomonas sp.]
MDFTGQRASDLNHHWELGNNWLKKARDCESSIAASYAAFEFRLALERLAFQYWFQLEGEHATMEDAIHASHSLKRMEQFIYRVGGNQLRIDRQFDLVRIFFDELGIERSFATPQVGQLSSHWHTCSDYCHIGWTIFQEALEDRLEVYDKLGMIADYLRVQIDGIIGWPGLPVAERTDLNSIVDDFVTGKIGADELRSFIKSKGLWAKVVYNDGRPAEFAGRAVPPEN